MSSQSSAIHIYQDLETKIESKRHRNFKSEGERRIACFLETNSIRYHYEPGVLVNSPYDKPRLWYPDFYLPEFGSYIEYYGLAGRENYDRGIKTKESVYSRMGLSVIPVYPWTFAENWQDYIMRELRQTVIRRYDDLMSKPYWSNSKQSPFHRTSPSAKGYRQPYRQRY